jgi:hypothetical protein
MTIERQTIPIIKSQNLLRREDITEGGSRIEMIGWTETDSSGDQWHVNAIEIDDVRVVVVKCPIRFDRNQWMAESLFAVMMMR